MAAQSFKFFNHDIGELGHTFLDEKDLVLEVYRRLVHFFRGTCQGLLFKFDVTLQATEVAFESVDLATHILG